MRYVQRRLYPAAAMRVTMTLCPCEYDCGGLELTVVGTDDMTCFPTAHQDIYSHLSRAELLDLVDVAADELI